MKEHIELLKSNFTIATLIFYVFGYAYLSIYYLQFDISIVNYINVLDILLTSVNFFAILLLICLLIEFGLFFVGLMILNGTFHLFIRTKVVKRLGNSTRAQKYLETKNNKYYSDNIKGTTFFVFLLLAFSALYFGSEKIMLASLFLPFFIIKLYQITPKEQGIRQLQLNRFFLGFLTIMLILCFIYWGYIDGISAKENKNGKQLEFKEQDILYNTKSDSLNFVGETNGYIFLYHTKNRETLIFNKMGTTGLKIKDSSPTKDEKEAQQKEAQNKVNEFFEKLKGN